MITFCKPCFVPQYSNDYSSRTLVVIIYLQKLSFCPSPRSIPRKKAPLPLIWVSRSWGLPRSTLSISGKATSLWHFYRYSCHIRKGLRHFPGRQQFKLLPKLIFSPGTNTTGISARASMDFPLQHKCCSNYPNVSITKFIIADLYPKLQWK